MRIFLVIDETRFYHPDFVADFLRRTDDEVVGGALVIKIPPKNSCDYYLRRNWHCLRMSEMFKLAWLKYSMAFKEIVSPKNKDSCFYSVRSVYNQFKIEYIQVEDSINKVEYLDFIRKKAPDVIISSNSLFFKKNLLDIPKICCLNRHSALLPAYGGQWPVLWACIQGEEYTGVSVHVMEEKIDQGAVLAQKKIVITSKDSVADLYRKCFQFSSDVVLAAIEKVRNNDFSPCSNGQPSYYSGPAKKDWEQFRQRGRRFI